MQADLVPLRLAVDMLVQHQRDNRGAIPLLTTNSFMALASAAKRGLIDVPLFQDLVGRTLL